jgi:RND superfamily putative drug exporter
VLTFSVLAVVAAAVFGFGVFGSLANGGFDDPETESARQLEAERDAFTSHAADVAAIYTSDTMTVDDPEFEAAVDDVVDGLPADAVERVSTYYDTGSPALVSADGDATMVVITLAGESQDDKATSYEEVEPTLEADGLTTYVGGQWAVFSDVNETVSADIARAESIAMPIVFLLCLVIFGSIVSAAMPVLVGTIAVFGAFAVVRLITMVTEVSVFSINIITLIGMGLAIDYALFMVSRFREELAGQPGNEREHVAAAIVRTMATAGRTVFFSGLIVAASLLSLLIFPQNFLRSMGYGGVAAVLVAMTAALTVLPAVLVLLGRRIDAGRMPWKSRTRDSLVIDGHGWWSRVAHSVMRRPIAYLAVITVALLAVGTPFLSATWGSVDERVLPPDAPSHVAADVQASEFGGETSTASIIVEGADATTLSTYVDDLSGVDGVSNVQVVDQTQTADGPVALVEVTWPGNGQTEASQDMVRDLRAVEPAGDATALVGGPSAQTVDLIASIADHLPWMALMVVVVMLVLLFIAFGSVVLPIKAILINALSLSASFGAVVWIFQDGNLSEALGVASTGSLDATQPLLMLALAFGLSMDYEVFLLSRVREQWDRGGGNAESVAAGLDHTGRIITSAALLLVVVIGGFSTSGISFLKMIGIGMMIAIVVDATVVRVLLVPATMRLLGGANWWAPAPLAAFWLRHGFRETVTTPAATDGGTSAPLPAPHPSTWARPVGVAARWAGDQV